MQVFVIVRWNKDKWRLACKVLIDKGMCDKGFIWNPSNCEFDKSCDVGEYVYCKNCKCRNKLVDELVGECIENIDGNKMIYNETLNENTCNSCTIYILYYLSYF